VSSPATGAADAARSRTASSAGLIQSEKPRARPARAGIAHELNNPLQGVLGHLELLRATGAFPKDLRRDVQLIYREADRAAKIVGTCSSSPGRCA
jgi:signal transduction histidine kinase